ncbi:hypothetical protein BV22DRAFT_333734 [Leucogyrophana mollusca]|uniref:Uncharacterized protein n=1 Tax=Leucogyrophana mollusca TaxID=85980 RepID=A0ACB8BMB4_9AGAM|nr:hypothetical protein BV22DRAFT_333734 [Leucogyrophana mollusca]
MFLRRNTGYVLFALVDTARPARPCARKDTSGHHRANKHVPRTAHHRHRTSGNLAGVSADIRPTSYYRACMRWSFPLRRLLASEHAARDSRLVPIMRRH